MIGEQSGIYIAKLIQKLADNKFWCGFRSVNGCNQERPTPHYSVKRHSIVTLSLYGPQLKWSRSVVFITNTQRCKSVCGFAR